MTVANCCMADTNLIRRGKRILCIFTNIGEYPFSSSSFTSCPFCKSSVQNYFNKELHRVGCIPVTRAISPSLHAIHIFSGPERGPAINSI
jgi:hypothetical protein